MGRADVLVNSDSVQAHLDHPGLVLAEADQGGTKWARRRLSCTCRHGRDAHRHYRSGSDCALCECLRWSPSNSVPRLVRRWPR